MSKKNTVIEINGKRYDAKTGAVLQAHASAPPKSHRSIDGITAPTVKVSHPQPSAPSTANQPVHSGPHKTVHDVFKRTPKAAAGHQPQPSHTLMRHVVKKPAAGLKRHTKALSSTDSLLPHPKQALDIKHSVQQLDAKRLQHAKRIPKSHLISRFSTIPAAAPVISAPLATTQQASPAHSSVLKSVTTYAPKHPKTTADVLEQALKHAAGHPQPAHHSKKRHRFAPSKRITSVSALVLATAVLVGFVGYQNLTAIKLHVASSKAGFTASLPGYQPTGYRLSHLNYNKGEIALHFQNKGTSSRSYAITEKPSAWDSAALHDVFVASLDQSYQTVEAGGRTLYLYGQSSATWVDGGVWYQIQANNDMSDQQLVQLATSM